MFAWGAFRVVAVGATDGPGRGGGEARSGRHLGFQQQGQGKQASTRPYRARGVGWWAVADDGGRGQEERRPSAERRTRKNKEFGGVWASS
jgi:hypothetical protein